MEWFWCICFDVFYIIGYVFVDVGVYFFDVSGYSDVLSKRFVVKFGSIFFILWGYLIGNLF